MRASYLFKQNIEALLKARGQRPHDLAFFCRRSDAWLSKILGKDDRNLPMKYLDKFADFFGIAAYQLFQPGISPLTERRKGGDRRTGRDRRVSRSGITAPAVISAADVALSKEDIAFLLRVRSLGKADRAKLEQTARAIEKARKKHGPSGEAAGVDAKTETGL